jgi:inorganic pyrophosphatase
MLEVYIENAAGSSLKNIYDENTLDFIKSVRVSAEYPYPYGFILDTVSGDGDNIDCFVLGSRELETGQVVKVSPVGLLEMREDGQVDHKVIARIAGDAAVDPDELAKITDFLDNVFTHLPGKKMTVGQLLSKQEALSFIKSNGSV